jgi:hypothetical protein
VAAQLPAAIAAAVAAAMVLHTAWNLVHFSWTTLYGDQWRIFSDYLRVPFPQSLLLVQNGHRPVFPGVLYHLDFFLLGASNRLLLTAAIACLLGLLFMVSRWVWVRRDLDAATRVVLISLLWVSQVWLANFRVLAHGNGGLHAYPVFLLLAVAVAALDRRAEHGPGWRGGAWAGVAVAAAAVATFTYSFGVVLWPVLLFAALVLRLPWGSLVALGAGAGASLLLYLRVLPQPDAFALGKPHLSHVLPDAMVWLAAPIYHAWWGFVPDVVPNPLVYASIGAVVGGTSLAILLLAAWRRPALGRLELWCLAAIAFSLGCALLVAYGRSGYFVVYPEQRLAARYVPWPTLLWAHLLMLAGIALARLRRGRRAAQVALFSLVAATMWLLRPSQVTYGVVLRLSDAAIREAGLALAVGVEDPARLQTLWPEVVQVIEVAGYLEAEGSGVFGWEATRALGHRLAVAPGAGAGAVCGGLIGSRTLPDGAGQALEFRGWALDERGRPPRHLLVLDGERRVVGAALFTRAALEATATGAPAGLLAGYVGYVDDYRGEEAYRLVAVPEQGSPVDLGRLAEGAGRSFCPPPG